MKNGFKLLCIFLVFFTLTACQSDKTKAPEENVKKAMVIEINRYYDNINNSFGSTLLTLSATPESKKKISGLSLYLIKHGYKVTRITEPKYITYEEPYAIYEVTIKVKYPDDYQTEYKVKKNEETIIEKLWVNPETVLIEKIDSKDDFLYSRTSK